MWRHCLITILLIFLTGCLGGGGVAPTRYYLIDPVDYSSSNILAVRPLKIEIIDLQIPQYLERFHIATRSSETQLDFSESHQWGENLRKNLLRTMSRNLSKLLSTVDIGTPLNRSSSQPDYRIQIHIDQFELDVDNTIKLIARWQISDLQTGSLGVFNADLISQEVIEEKDYDQIVIVMRELFGKLGLRISETILEQEN